MRRPTERGGGNGTSSMAGYYGMNLSFNRANNGARRH